MSLWAIKPNVIIYQQRNKQFPGDSLKKLTTIFPSNRGKLQKHTGKKGSNLDRFKLSSEMADIFPMDLTCKDQESQSNS